MQLFVFYIIILIVKFIFKEMDYNPIKESNKKIIEKEIKNKRVKTNLIVKTPTAKYYRCLGLVRNQFPTQQLIENHYKEMKNYFADKVNYIDVYKDINAIDDAKFYLTDRLNYLNQSLS